MEEIKVGNVFKNKVDDKYFILEKHEVKGYYKVLFVPHHDKDPIKEMLMYVDNIKELIRYGKADVLISTYTALINDMRWI